MSHAEPVAQANEKRPAIHLKLFVAEGEPNSTIAQANLRKLQRVNFQFDLAVEIVNVLDDYQAALEHRVLVTPCLVLHTPLPRVMIVGTLSDQEKVIGALRLIEQERLVEQEPTE